MSVAHVDGSMATQLTPQRFDLDAIEGWPAGNSRTLNFRVFVDTEATPKDITNDVIRWRLVERPYHDAADAVLDGETDGVDIRTEGVVDPTAGEFRVDIGPGVTDALWGEYTQVVVVDPLAVSRQSWRGDVLIEDSGV